MKRLSLLLAFIFVGSTPAAELTRKLSIKEPDGYLYAEIRCYDNGDIKINQGGTELKGSFDQDKRKYKDPNKIQRFETKQNDAGFKLRTANGVLLYKVSTQQDKIKISDNEENLNPYEIRWKTREKAKLKRADTLVSEAIYYPETGKLKVKDSMKTELYTTRTNDLLPGFAVLGMQRLAGIERLIIFAELTAR